MNKAQRFINRRLARLVKRKKMKHIVCLVLFAVFVVCLLWTWLKRKNKRVIDLISTDPDKFEAILKDKSLTVYQKRRSISKVTKVQSSDSFIEQTALSHKRRDESYSRVKLIDIDLLEKEPKSKKSCAKIKRKYAAMFLDMSMMPTGQDILYCAFVNYQGEWFRYIGITSGKIENRWGYAYPSSHFTQCHATRNGSAARMCQGPFGAHVRTRDYRYLMMALVEPEDIIVVYKRFDAISFVKHLFSYFEIDMELPWKSCREIPENMLIRKYKTDRELNEKSSIPAMTDRDDELLDCEFSKFLS